MKSFHLNKVLLILLFVISELRGVPLEDRFFLRNPLPKSAVTPIPFYKNTLENIPKLSQGHKQYQFYNMGPDGALHKQWMSLQEVQNIILAYAMTRQAEGIAQSLKMASFSDQLNDDLQGKFGFGLPVLETKKPQRASIEDVLANVQKVMSKEITNQLLSTEKTSAFTTMISKEVNETKTKTDMPQNITIPDTILAHLMKEQVESLETHSPWGIISPNPSTEIFNGVFNTDTSMTPTPNGMVDDEISQENFILEDIITTTERNPELSKKESSTNKNKEKNSLHSTAISEENNKKVTKLPMLESDSATRIENLEKFISNVLSAEPSLYDKPSYTVIPVKDLDSNDPMKLSILTTTEEYLTSLPNEYQKTSEELLSELIEKFNSTFDEQSKTTLPPNDDITISTENSTTTAPKKTRTTPFEEPRTVSQTKMHKKSQIELTTKPFRDPTSITTNAVEKESSTKTTMLKKIISTTSAKKSTTEATTKRSHKPSTTSTRNPETSTNKAIKHKPESENHNSKSSSSAGHMKDVSNSPTNVLTPLEMAPLSFENLENLGVLQDDSGLNDDLYDYAPVYLEDISETNYNDNVESSSQKTKSNDTMAEILDFPSQHNTDSYGKPDHVLKTDPDDYSDVDPTQFLPSHNPELAKGENPLRKTPFGNEGLEKTVMDLKPEIRGYVNAMNDIAFQIYKKAAKIHRRQNLVMSPLNLISSLSMLTLGARGSTAELLSQLLRADDFIMFNPHQLLKNITETVLKLNKIGHEVAFVNNIFIEEPEVKPYDLEFFSRTVDYFYNSSVQQIAAQDFGTIARDLANEAVRKQTLGAVQNFLKPKASLKVLGPLSVVSSAYFQANWIIDIKEEDIFDMNFIRFPSAERRRRLIRTVGLNRRMTLNAGYSDQLDATVTEIPLLSSSKEISLILVMPGQQKRFIANGLSKLEQDLTSNTWRKMLKSVIPHTLNFKMPIFSHRNYLNLSSIFTTMELDALLQNETDFSGINGAKELRLGDAVQLTEFHSCKLNTKMFAKRSIDSVHEPLSSQDRNPNINEDAQGTRDIAPKAREILPGSSDQEDTTSDGDKVLSFDRAFFYVLRHNPTGLVLFIGRYLDPETF